MNRIKYLASLLVVPIIAGGCMKSRIEAQDARGNPIVYEQRLGGRGCIAISTNLKGGIDMVVQQDGSDDWIGLRTLPLMMRAGLSVLFGTRDPAGTTEANDGPSAIQGCAGLFETVEEEEVEEETND